MSRFPIQIRSHKLSLWLILVVPFVLQISSAVGLVGYLSYRNGQKAVNDLVQQLSNEVSERVDQHLDTYLALPHQLNELTLDAIATGKLSLLDLKSAGRYLWKQTQVFKNISYVGFNLENGDGVGAGRWITGLDIVLYEQSAATKGRAAEYVLDHEGNQMALLQTYDYDAVHEDWYVGTAKVGKPTWTRIYTSESTNATKTATGIAIQQQFPEVGTGLEAYIAASANAPIYDKQQRLLGVLNIDLLLGNISEYLQDLHISPSGRVFIVEQTGVLVASSGDQPVYKVIDQTPKRLNALEYPDPLIRASAAHIQQQLGGFQSIQTTQQTEFVDQGKRTFVQIHPWRDQYGLSWLMVVAIPESDFMGTIHQNTRMTFSLCLMALLLATWMGLITSRWLVRQLLTTIHAADALSQGTWNQRVPESRASELSLLAKAFNRMAEQLQDSFTRLEYSAYHDALTGLLNQAAFRRQLAKIITAADRSSPLLSAPNTPPLFAVLFLDLDQFKLVNDSLGHLAGDRLLIEVTQRLQTCVGDQDVMARFGGDEFVILLRSIAHVTEAIQAAEQILKQLKHPFKLGNKDVFMSTSIGVFLGSPVGMDVDTVLRNADIALYRAKSNGKAIYEIFDSAMHIEIAERVQLEIDLRHALEHNELEVYYQPIVDLYSLQITGLEALTRWRHPTLGMISPSKFIPIAEETGLIVALSWWVLRQACLQMRHWQQELAQDPSMTINVNLSGKQFLQPDLPEQIHQILCETGLPAQSLKLEITESFLMSHRESILTQLHQLTSLGIQLGVDDFGTGYSSLSYLHHFPLNTLKVDRSFIQQIDGDDRVLAIVEAIVLLAHKLGMTVVAEGVETREQLDYLRQMVKCEQIQGFLISQAIPASQITQWMAMANIATCASVIPTTSHPLKIGAKFRP